MARILIGNIKGPKGDQGIQGPQGKQGIQGPQGPLPPLVNNALATESGVAALDSAMGKTLKDLIDNTNSDLAYETVGITKNINIVTESYSFGYRKSGIGVLNIDLYIASTAAAYTEYEILYTGFRPKIGVNIIAANSVGKITTIMCSTDGTVKINTHETSGAFNIRAQIILAE